MLATDDNFINDYLAESHEHLADIENDLLTIETAGAARDEALVNKVFRAAHSIKGGAGFFSLSKIQELAHRLENVLDLIRSHEMEPEADVINLLLQGFDRLRALLHQHQTSGAADISELVVALSGLVAAHLSPKQKSSLANVVRVTAPGVRTVLHIPEFDFNRAKEGGNYLYLVEYDLIDDVQRRGKRPLDVLYILSACGKLVEAAFDLEAAGTLDDEPTNRLPFFILFATELGPETTDVLFDVPASQIHVIHSPTAAAPEPAAASTPVPAATSPVIAAPVPVTAVPAPVQAVPSAPANPEPAPAQPEPTATAHDSGGETTLRVEVGLLENLMNLAGELVLSRNQLLEALTGNDGHNMQASAQRISLVTSELQEAIMLTRMQPIGNIFNKFPRVVRDLARDLGKDVRLDISGREVALDKTIIEGLSEPLTHMVRNAVDHGLETPDVRTRAGKPAQGAVQLKAYHAAGQVVVEVSDDGRGLDAAKIAAAALAKGQITPEQARGMSDKEKTALIFLPGLSTADKVSDVSGRGVGMDVVKTNLDRLGGQIEIDTVVGRGTRFIIKLPLTLAIIPSLLVSTNNERFAIPQTHISELIHLTAGQVAKRIEVVGDAEVLVLRGNLIPLVRLSDALGVAPAFYDPSAGQWRPDRRSQIADRRSPRHSLLAPAAPATGSTPADRRATSDRRLQTGSDLNIVIITTGTLDYGLVVDALHDTVEIVVKPLGRHLKGLHLYAGATILGDGHVALILDAAGLPAQQALVSMAGSQRAAELAAEARRDEAQGQQAFLTFRNAPTEYCALPLELVERVVQVRPDQVEWVGGRRTMQYRGGALPLVTLKDAAPVADLPAGQDLAVIIVRLAEREVGLLASLPVDVLDATAAIDQETLRQKGILGSMIAGGHTTLIVDIYALVEAVRPDWAAPRPAAPAPGTRHATVLLAEDSDFFRTQVRRFMEEAGYTVLAAPDGQAAWNLLQQNASVVRLVLTDIEMPLLDGLGLTRALRADPRFAALPVIALTSLAGEDDIARGTAAGVTDYQIKLDRDKLLDSARRLLAPVTA